MRFNEFKLTEAKTDDFYTVGDSHARGVGTTAGLDGARNLAVNGAAAHGRGVGREMLANIVKIPKGANVLISVGANDTADVVKQNLTSQGKIKLPPASKIVGDVMNVVNAVKAQGVANIVFMLFPSGDNKKTKYYAGDFQKEVRDALKSAVGVKVIDYDGSPMQNDGIHYQFGVYRKAADETRRIFGSSTTRPETPPVGGKPTDTQFAVVLPNKNRGPAVADMQKALVALGYPLPRFGVDGIRGPETSKAIRDFQKAAGIAVDGDPGPETILALNNVLKTKPDIVAKLTKSTEADVKPGKGNKEVDAASSTSNVKLDNEKIGEARQSAEKFLGRNMSDDEWTDLVKATGAEASNNTKECAYVMAVILNRTRKGYGGGRTVNHILNQENQFQAVTGTPKDRNPSKWYVQGPSKAKLGMIVDGAINILPSAPKDIYRFTAADPRAYGPGTTIGYLHKLKADGGTQIGGTIFA
jgi:hypothetical protein